MFTGIIQDLGKVKSRVDKGGSIKFLVEPKSKKFLKGVKAGDSISINGACMTVEKISANKFRFTTIIESLSKTNLSMLKLKGLINLEKAMTIYNKLDGHIVQGHVDTTGTVKKIDTREDSWEYYIEIPAVYKSNIIPVGSISVNGVSLTIAEIVKEDLKNILIKIAIIPHTHKFTNFKRLSENDLVNIEFDMIGKYVNRIFENENKKPASK